MYKVLPFVFITCFAALAMGQTPVQSLRGVVTNADNARPLPGASLVLLGTNPLVGTSSNESGAYVFEKLPVGRYRLQVTFVGFETLTLAEVLVEAGRETVLDLELAERGESLQEVVVKAQGRSGSSLQPLSVHTMTVEEQFRFPATYYDPARLATAYPGVAGENDGTNIISVRGNSPNALQWRLEGVEIVNPNHTANAGTFSDRPTQAAGGVNILSAQLLGTSNFLTSAFPAEYGNALGGILDLHFRKGNETQHELIAQAGFIGIEAAAEGPLPGGKAGKQPSFLLNYRYSFTGLLTAMGADFGDEATDFQDLSFHLALPTAKAGDFTVFGMGGKSATIFRSPIDSALITEQKQLYDIDFQSKMGALGVTHLLPLGQKGVWRTTLALSALEHQRTADLVESAQQKERREADDFVERKLAFSSVFTQRAGPRLKWKTGVLATQQHNDIESMYRYKTGQFNLDGQVDGWLFQPFADLHAMLRPSLELTTGLHLSHLTNHKGHTSLEPRAALRFSPRGKGSFSLAYGLHSQTQWPQLYLVPATSSGATRIGFSKAHHWVAGYQQNITPLLVVKLETYYQKQFDVPVVQAGADRFSTVNLTDFSLPYLQAVFGPTSALLGNEGKGRNYGLEASLQRFISDKAYFLLSGSLYRAEFATSDGAWLRSRFDGGHAVNLTGGREFLKNKQGKTVVKGVNARIAWLGGFRDMPIDEAASAAQGYTVYQAGSSFSVKHPDYFRTDLRLYIKWNKQGRSSTLSLDLQNLLNRKNTQYQYYDSVKGAVATKLQLGLIPIMTWRGEF